MLQYCQNFIIGGHESGCWTSFCECGRYVRGSGAAVRWRSARGSERRATRSLDPRGSDIVLVVLGMQSPSLSRTRRRFLLFTSLSRFLAVMNGCGYAIAMQLCPITSSRCGSVLWLFFADRPSLGGFTVCWPFTGCVLKKLHSTNLQCFCLLIVRLFLLPVTLIPFTINIWWSRDGQGLLRFKDSVEVPLQLHRMYLTSLGMLHSRSILSHRRNRYQIEVDLSVKTIIMITIRC